MEAGEIQEWVSRGNLILVETGRLQPAGDKNAWHTVRPTQLSAISDNVKNSHLVHGAGGFPTAPRSPNLGSRGGRVDKSREQPLSKALISPILPLSLLLRGGSTQSHKKVCC